MAVSCPLDGASPKCYTHEPSRDPFSVVTIRSFLSHRKELEVLSSHSASLTSYRYLRLMLFACVDVVILLPINFYILYLSIQQPMYVWRGLSDLHFGFSAVEELPTSVWRLSQSSINQVMITPSVSIAACFVFFAFFGLAEESRHNYSRAYHAITGFWSRGTKTHPPVPERCDITETHGSRKFN